MTKRIPLQLMGKGFEVPFDLSTRKTGVLRPGLCWLCGQKAGNLLLAFGRSTTTIVDTCPNNMKAGRV